MRLIDSQVTATTKYVELTMRFSPFDYRDVHTVNQTVTEGDDIQITVNQKKRSQNANSYYWNLINKIARKLESTATEVHNKALSDYGEEWLDGDGNRVFVLLPDDGSYIRNETIHLKPTARISRNPKGISYRTFVLMKPSHLYNTGEFSRLLDGVIRDAKQLGIETESEEWVERIKSLWKSVK